MKKITFSFFLALLLLAGNLFAGTPLVKSSTAWFNSETFESFSAPLNLTADIASPNSGYKYSNWAVSGCYVGIQSLSTASTTGSATGCVMAFPSVAAYTETLTTFADSPTGSTSGAKISTKSTTDATNPLQTLSGYVYIKTSFYANTYSNSYKLLNSSGQEVFAFNNTNTTSNAFSTTNITAATWAIGARAKWGDIEAVLDLNGTNKVAKKITFTYNGSSKSLTDIALTNGGSVTQFSTSTTRCGGLDNTTIAELLPDNIQNLISSQSIHQTGDGTVTTTLGVTPISTAMDLILSFSGANTDINVQWIIDKSKLSEADKNKVSITRSETDYTSATLSTTGTISADADITVTASVAGKATLTKVISLKSGNIDGVKATLLDEITSAKTSLNAVTDVNPYINSLKSDFNTVINAGQGAYDNVASTITDITTATSNIVTAKTAFSNGMATYNAYVNYINSVKAGRDTVGVNYPSAAFFTAIKGTLNDGITAAENAKTTFGNTTDISNATTDLFDAYTVFNTDRQTFYALGAQFNAAQLRYNAVFARKGDTKFLQFPALNVDALKTAIDIANTTLNTGTTAIAMTNETTAMNTALITFNNASRIAPSTNYYRIFSYGVSGGDGSEVKKVLFSHTINAIPTYRLAWCSIADSKNITLGDSALWMIAVGSANNKYTIQNKATGKYLNLTAFSDTPVEFTLLENKSQNGYINGFLDWSTKLIADPNLIYSMSVGTSALEVRADSVAPYTNLRTGGVADRYRFAFQFEEAVAPVINAAETSVKAFACNAGQTDQTTLTISGDNLFGATIHLGISGANADAYSVSTATISPSNTYIRNNAVTVTYNPLTGGAHSAKLTVSVDGGNTLEYDLSGSVITSVVGNNNFNNDIYVKNGKIHFNATAGEQVNVFTATGIKIAGTKAVDGLNSISVNANGIFIVQVGNRTAKVVL